MKFLYAERFAEALWSDNLLSSRRALHLLRSYIVVLEKCFGLLR